VDESLTNSRTLQAHFSGLAASAGTSGPIGEVVHLLSVGELTPTVFGALCRKHGLQREQWFRGQVLDLVIGYVQDALRSGALTSAHQADVRILSMCLDISAGEFVDRRPAEIAALLGEELERILDDDVIDDAEELYQVDLQTAFGLGYDDYLTLVRTAFERAHADLSARAARGEAVGAKLRALEPIYRLATSRPRSLGALY
jgi:hypothetical protein